MNDQPLWIAVTLFSGAGLVILVLGTLLTRLADRLADVTGLGEAVTGAVLLGAITSASGSVTSVTAALDGHPELALGNAFGGIAGQTAFLVVADAFHRHANLEHAAASLENMLSGVVLIALLTLILVAASLPPLTVFAVHPVSPLLVCLYIVSVRLASSTRRERPWVPRRTPQTREDVPDEDLGGRESVARLALTVIAIGLVVSLAGAVIAQSGLAIAAAFGLREGVVGALLTALVTSMPELVTTVAAVRQGALTLAVGGILGGNAFDVLFAAFSDAAWRDGSAYHAMGEDLRFLVILCILMTATLLLGLLRRQTHGPANIGWESTTLLALYLGGMAAFVLAF